ncbi:thiol reductant ABC exporter subunit CydC [Pseudoalteromonas sp. SG43-7]|uniref:thiol reductant ABC exporter subunit CydC n=1 Tax=unclassified Pseudoalteromonas TaxID=194690 RepID=UPI001604174D|nr:MULTISPECIES: thiol reductant ABC exporter subunit CydC [unclassified Pseudoalteromonas]MBB1334541.1 thiol reductant ABC exporter subunit CydC [Pseudoalteromonas sp. SR41-6]MBB1423608.1 thiol reductant ABC exporter subunit CydC [Pseudoalteromonas sp. SG43-7]MBB1458553.1 thiol reductant ABC exporter subunit CydC [Pseudoalteromonas sp. SG41-8]
MTNFLRLLKLCRPHLGAMLLGAFLATLTVLANVGLLAISGWFLAAMAAAGLAGTQMNYFTPAGTIRFLAIVRTASRYGERLVTHNATFLLLSEIRVSVFNTLSQLSNVDLAMSRSADLFNRMQNDVEALDKFYLNVLLPMIVALISVPIVVAIMAAYNSNVALLCFTALLIVGVALPLILSKQLQQTANLETHYSATLRAELSDTLSGLRELAIYQATEQQIEQCRAASERYNRQLFVRHSAEAHSNGVSLLIVQLSMLGAIVIIAPLVYSGAMANVELAMLSLFVLASFETVLTLPNAFIQLPVALSAAKRIFDLEDKLRPETTSVQESLSVQPVGLEFKDLSYCYHGDTFALNNLSFAIEPLQKVAIVGQSGSGKSTLVNLLSGLWPQQNGEINLNSADKTIEINTISQQNRCELINIVAQQHHIFDGTIAENLRYAAPSATKQQMRTACQQTQLGDWLSELKLGLDTRLGTGGRSLSRGQSRRLALAQALLRAPAILVLDEPTEGLDNQSKHQVMDAILTSMGHCTVISITHDPALLANMDNVIWLEQGQIKAIATHQQLLAEQPDYMNLITRF